MRAQRVLSRRRAAKRIAAARSAGDNRGCRCQCLGETTDELHDFTHEATPDRPAGMLLTSGEGISAAKLAALPLGSTAGAGAIFTGPERWFRPAHLQWPAAAPVDRPVLTFSGMASHAHNEGKLGLVSFGRQIFDPVRG